MDINSQLEQFLSWPQKLSNAGLTVTPIDSHCFSIQYRNSKKTSKEYDIFLSALIHGNEIGGLGVINHFLEKLILKPHSLSTKILIHLGNIDAAKKNVRFLERDLNRSFLLSSNSNFIPLKLEEKIAQRIETLVLKCSFNIDLHQTNSASITPFFIFTYSKHSLNWAKFLNSKIPTITSTVERHKDGSTLDYFCLKNSIPSCTLELGQAGLDPFQIQFGADILDKILDLPKEIPVGLFENIYKVIETIYWSQRRIYLKPGFENFSIVQKTEPLGFYDSENGPEVFLSPYNGAVLFPKYGKIANQTQELITFAEPIFAESEI